MENFDDDDATIDIGDTPTSEASVQLYLVAAGKTQKEAATLVKKHAKLVERGYVFCSNTYYVGNEILEAEEKEKG